MKVKSTGDGNGRDFWSVGGKSVERRKFPRSESRHYESEAETIYICRCSQSHLPLLASKDCRHVKALKKHLGAKNGKN